MRIIILKSTKTDVKIELHFGIVMSQADFSKEAQAKILNEQGNKNVDAITKHYEKFPDDTLIVEKTIIYAD